MITSEEQPITTNSISTFAMTSLLLKGGNVLIHDTDDKVTPTRADVLVEGSRITKIEPSITAPDGCEVIDCTDKIVSPGLIDTHHHMWQSPLKGLFGDSAFVPYMALSEYTALTSESHTDVHSHGCRRRVHRPRLLLGESCRQHGGAGRRDDVCARSCPHELFPRS